MVSGRFWSLFTLCMPLSPCVLLSLTGCIVCGSAEEFGMQMFKLLSTSYSSMYVDEAARILGVTTAETTACE